MLTSNPLLDVLGGLEPERRAMWFMRQAGRYLPEYRAVREKAGSFLDLCYNPVLASEVTLQPLRRYDLDAAILFADILVVPHAMGLPLRFEEGEGPILGTVRSGASVDELGKVKGSREVEQVCRTVALTRSVLGSDKALIGFCGAPWTVATYMVGGRSSERLLAKVAALQRAGWFVDLIDRLVEESVDYLCAQVDAGAQVLQIFDSWAGDLVGEQRDEFVFGALERVVGGVRERFPSVPIILFARGVGMDQNRVSSIAGVSAIGVEAELNLGLLGTDVVVQGNLDPVALLAGVDVAVREAEKVCRARGKGKHIFNLGHGIRVGTEPEVVGAVVDAVRRFDG